MMYLIFGIRIIFFTLFLYASYFALNAPILAVPMDSSRFKIESTSVGVASDNKGSSDYELADAVGQLAANRYLQDGYVVKPGFQYLNFVAPFHFSVSNVNIALGALVPNTPSAVTTNLIIHFEGTGQYQITAVEEGPLKTQSGNAIPDTSCDGKVNTCSQSLAKAWSSNSAYGFGYSLSGNDIPVDFINSTYYRPFPDQTSNEPPTTVMANININKNRQSIVTFKTNISSIQQAGSYQTVINFVATPSY